MLRAGWLAALICYAALALWLLRHSPSIPSDDAFFFVGGTLRFSVLEFRPHFPGYPGFIFFSKLLHLLGLSSKQAVFFLSLFSALALPPLATWAARDNGASEAGRLLVFFTVLTQPFLSLVGLSMMSDATGIAFFFAAISLMGKEKYGSSGVCAGLALACRPSFLVPVALVLFAQWCRKKEARLKLFIATAGTLFLFFGAVLLLEGSSYMNEALRFTKGHFSVWGNTSFEESANRASWLDAIATEPIAFAALLLLMLFGALTFAAKPKITPLFIAMLSSVLWTAFAQNPESLRHVLLPSVLVVVWMASVRVKYTNYTLLIAALLQLILWPQILLNEPNLSPLEQVGNYLSKQNEGLLITNHGLYTLRDKLGQHQVIDAYYTHSTRIHVQLSNQQRLWKVSSSTPSENWCKAALDFKGRVPGEKKLLLFSVCPKPDEDY
ncbi:hypothetical protein [Flexibacterium corallicola]|uniref:hypothetical protein n=1 Tax=Flexibacterium corallicola TaxID=3037259 RepID=UPI00286EF4F0|nr:hypothetical protein [Pseudovibrio sp. M1P-2-3]